MNKRIKPTPEILEALKRVNNGAEVDTNTIAIYEAQVSNTRPIRKKGLYKDAVVQPHTLTEMVNYLNASNEGIPLHLMHERSLLNVGKWFMARTDMASDGHTELTGLFYMPLSEDKLIARLDSSVVDQVSVGLLGKALNCSECSWDYLGEDSDITNVLGLTCKNGHTLGENGVHLNINGMDSWFEASLVDHGGAFDARIVSADQSKFSKQEDFYRLAASNRNKPENFLPLIATLSVNQSEEVPEMDETKVNELIAAALTARETEFTGKIAGLEATIAELMANQADEVPNEEVSNAAAELTAAQEEVTQLKEQVTALQASLDEVTAFLKDEATKAQVASGSTAPLEASDASDAITKIKASGVLIAKLFAKDEQVTIEANKSEPTDIRGLAAFKAKR